MYLTKELTAIYFGIEEAEDFVERAVRVELLANGQIESVAVAQMSDVEDLDYDGWEIAGQIRGYVDAQAAAVAVAGSWGCNLYRDERGDVQTKHYVGTRRL